MVILIKKIMKALFRKIGNKMQTSYYSKSAKSNSPNLVSIAARAPAFYKGREYKKLAPKYWFFKKYKDDGDEEFYTKAYYEEVLNKLDPKTVYKELGKDSVILCWESSDKFCHRHIVGKWSEEEIECLVSYNSLFEPIENRWELLDL